jgi:hypothetical protein
VSGFGPGELGTSHATYYRNAPAVGPSELAVLQSICLTMQTEPRRQTRLSSRSSEQPGLKPFDETSGDKLIAPMRPPHVSQDAYRAVFHYEKRQTGLGVKGSTQPHPESTPEVPADVAAIIANLEA